MQPVMQRGADNIDWESELAALLTELSQVQDDLLQIITEKRDLMVRSDVLGMAAMQPREDEVNARLHAAHQRRIELLMQAGQRGLPSESLARLTQALPKDSAKPLSRRVQQASARMRIVQQHSLTNWVLAQRTLLHLAQLMEILATGGRFQPTYGKGNQVTACGSLVDHDA